MSPSATVTPQGELNAPAVWAVGVADRLPVGDSLGGITAVSGFTARYWDSIGNSSFKVFAPSLTSLMSVSRSLLTTTPLFAILNQKQTVYSTG